VVAYTRPFTTAKTKVGKVQYPTRDLKREPGFDTALHEHLFVLRDQLIAHSDYSLLRSTMFVKEIGDPGCELPISVGLNVKRIVGLELRELAERYVRHFSSCVTRVARTFDAEFDEFARLTRDHPDYFRRTATLPIERIEHGPIPTLRPLPGPTGPAGNVKEPEFAAELSGYKYQKLTHERGLLKSGTYAVRINGAFVDYTFDVRGPDIDDAGRHSR
jgi:hypothetical protein